ncbi:MAG: hypothetical protein ACKVOH_02990 [Chlamydiales bacterium]
MCGRVVNEGIQKVFGDYTNFGIFAIAGALTVTGLVIGLLGKSGKISISSGLSNGAIIGGACSPVGGALVFAVRKMANKG